MATYGKKKRAIFPGFTVFQDETYTQLGKDDATRTRSTRTAKSDDDDIDELASTRLLDIPFEESDNASSQSSSHRPAFTEASSEPLPPLPLNTTHKSTKQERAKQQVLGPKSTNIKLATERSKVTQKSKISKPILISSSAIPTAKSAGTSLSTSDDATQFDSKVSSLKQPVTAQEPEPPARENLLASIETIARPSPLQRGKSVLVNAKRAIIDRLASPKIKLGKSKTFNKTTSRPQYRPVDQQFNYDTDAISSRLPVYESMRTRKETSEDPGDRSPFSDNMELDEAWSSQHWSGFEFDFSNRRVNHSSIQSTASVSPFSARTSEQEQLLNRSRNSFRFTNKLSGLAQHPDAEAFSSSPVGFSTPHVRLARMSDPDGKKRLSAVVVKEPSVLDFSFEDDSADDEVDPLMQEAAGKDLHSSMKRKSATEDLRSQAHKRPKTKVVASMGNRSLAENFDESEVGEQQMMQGIERSPDASPVKADPKEKVFGIHNIGKDKQSLSEVERIPRSTSIGRHGHRHSSSLTRPTSVLFSRESRARVPLLKSFDEDKMEIDELQVDSPGAVRVLKKA